MTLGEKIVLLRKKAGLSQEKLAEALSVSRQAVSKWESNQVTPDLNNVIALCKLFHISSDELLMSEALQLQNPKKESELDKILNFIKQYFYLIGYALIGWGSYRLVSFLIFLYFAYSTSQHFENSMNGMDMYFDIQGELFPKSIQMLQVAEMILPIIFYIGMIILGIFIVWKEKKINK